MKMYALLVYLLAAFLFVLIIAVGQVAAQEPVPSVVTSAAKAPVNIVLNIPSDAQNTATSTVITVVLDILYTTSLSGTEIVSSELSIAVEDIAGDYVVMVDIGDVEVFENLQTIGPEVANEPDVMSESALAIVLYDSNLRAGPGTAYDIVGAAQQGDELAVIGQDESKNWYLVDSGTWIAASLVDSVGSMSSITSEGNNLILELQSASHSVEASSIESNGGLSPIQYHSEEPRCDVYVLQQNQEEPQYVGVEGYIKGVPQGGWGDHVFSLPETPWFAQVLVQTGPDKWEAGENTILTKTPVIVVEQHLTHRKHGNYYGRFVVRSLVDNQLYVIPAGSFTLSDYWRCEPYQAVERSTFIAIVKEDVQLVDRKGRWQEMGPERRVYCDDRPSRFSDYDVVDAVECMVYKVYNDGYKGKAHIIPSAGLEIIY